MQESPPQPHPPGQNPIPLRGADGKPVGDSNYQPSAGGSRSSESGSSDADEESSYSSGSDSSSSSPSSSSSDAAIAAAPAAAAHAARAAPADDDDGGLEFVRQREKTKLARRKAARAAKAAEAKAAKAAAGGAAALVKGARKSAAGGTAAGDADADETRRKRKKKALKEKEAWVAFVRSCRDASTVVRAYTAACVLIKGGSSKARVWSDTIAALKSSGEDFPESMHPEADAKRVSSLRHGMCVARCTTPPAARFLLFNLPPLLCYPPRLATVREDRRTGDNAWYALLFKNKEFLSNHPEDTPPAASTCSTPCTERSVVARLHRLPSRACRH